MSQPLQMQLLDVKEWLSKETVLLIEPMKEKAASLLMELEQRVDDAKQNGQRIFENSQREMDKNKPKTYRFAGNANEFAQSLIETLQAVSVPDGFNYEQLQAFCGELEEMLASIEEQKRERYPYISPYFIFDRRRIDGSIRKLASVINQLRNFLTTEFAEAKTVEAAYSQIDLLLRAITEESRTRENRRQIETRERTLAKEMAEVQRKITQIRERAEFKELGQLTKRIEGLRMNVRHNLRYLQKPFSKLQSLARTGDMAVPLDEMNWLGDYMENSFSALVAEEDGYSTLKSILKRLDTAMDHGDLKLKSARVRKAQDQINNILHKGSLDQLQMQCRESVSQKKQLLTSGTITKLQNQLKQLQNKLKDLQRERELMSSKNESLKAELEKLRERMAHQRGELEKSIFQLTNRSVQIILAD